MDNISWADKKIIKTFSLKEDELEEAKYNLFGLFEVLYRIDQRLKKEKEEKDKYGLQ